MRHMGTRTTLRLNHEQRILNSGARLHGAETTPLGFKQHTPLRLYCYSHARGSALHRNMHCGAMADAARCVGRCSALRRPMQHTAFFATIRPPFRPTPFHQSKDCSPPILRNAQQALHQTDSDAPDTAFWHTQEKATPPHRAQRPPRTSPFRNFCLPIPYYSEAKSTKAPRAVGFSGKLFNFAREKGKDQPPSA